MGVSLVNITLCSNLLAAELELPGQLQNRMIFWPTNHLNATGEETVPPPGGDLPPVAPPRFSP
jgi:hypothetical protein